MILLRIFLLSAFFAVVARSPRLQASDTIRIATYNLENYTSAGRLVGDTYRKDYPKPEAAKRALHSVLASLDADILALQEMGPRPYLDELKHDLAALGLRYTYDALVEAGDPDRHIALLSRIPLRTVHTYAHVGFNYFGSRETVKRGIAEVSVATPRGEIVLWVVHLKSRFSDRSSDPSSALRRAGEAVAIRDLVLRRHPDPKHERFLIVGDFNDGKTRRPVQALQSRGRTIIATLLDASDSRGERWTHFYRREETYERVDHILVSPALMPFIERDASGEPKAQIHDTADVALASDHRPVVVTLRLGTEMAATQAAANVPDFPAVSTGPIRSHDRSAPIEE